MSREVLQQTYTLSEANVKDLIGWLRAEQINRALIALEHLNPAEPAQPVQTEQEPVGRVCFSGDEVVWTNDPPESGTLLYTSPPAPVQQEPVAFLAESTRFKVTLTERDCKITGLPRELGGRWVALIGAENDCHLRLTTPPLLVQPPKREWVDLTDEDVEIINGNTWDVREAVRMASAKSKEKNT